MQTFTAVTDQALADTIAGARSRVVLVAPGLAGVVAEASSTLTDPQPGPQITLILDPDEDAYRVGYGDPKGAALLAELVQRPNVTVRSEPGVRLGLLIADDTILMWAPTPKSVENGPAPSKADSIPPSEPNGIRLDSVTNLSEHIDAAVGSGASNTVLTDMEIGREPLSAERAKETMEALAANPPAPVNLSRMARVFSTKVQFVECTLRGAQWTERETKVSSLLLNADVSDDLAELFDTKIRPFSKQADVPIPVQAMIQGQLAFDKRGKPLLTPMTQAEIKQVWNDILKRYLHRMRGFGLLIRRADKPQFQAEIDAFEKVLKAWVAGFREAVHKDEDNLVKQITDLVLRRQSAAPARAGTQTKPDEIKAKIRDGVKGMRVIEPAVKLVFKDVSWESTGDAEFVRALRETLPAEDLDGWFKVYSAAPARGSADLVVGK
ncbi:hypothetical protein [uncultured Thiohalocapsa sp.]|uniref:hypothetical protein n=1 Tax=uncultured Thiohalocapsa sp. TaxID=768990 RepID=UPI0025DB4C55|nr:hypothetical protein [uncultured Thiohalocapsa sp.]